MKKCLICIYLLLVCILTGCSGTTENQVKIGLDMATRDGFLTSLETAAVKAASAEGIRLEVANANNDSRHSSRKSMNGQKMAMPLLWLCCVKKTPPPRF